MKKLIPLFLTVIITFFASCNRKYGKFPQTIIIAGKIDHYNPNWKVNISVNRIGFKLESIIAKTDSAGNFMATFESYIPLDAWITYKSNFLVLLHPGDSLFVRIDGNNNDLSDILESLKFSGDRAKTNQYAVKFQQMYFTNEIYYNWDKKLKAVQAYDADQYVQYLDTLQHHWQQLYELFVLENQPDKESKIWAQALVYKDYYHYLGWYAHNRRLFRDGGQNDTWNVPKGFYDRLTKRFPVDPSMFTGAYVLSDFSGVLKHYVYEQLRDRETFGEWYLTPEGELSGNPTVVDSIKIFSIIKFVSDPIMLQMMLTAFFDDKFDDSDIMAFDQYRDVIESCIKEPFLKDPLWRKYYDTRQKIYNIQPPPRTMLYNMADESDLSGNQIVDDLLQRNHGKLLYVVFWATWANQSMKELSCIKRLQMEWMDQDIVFAHICLESAEKQWTTTIDKYELGGRHYLLSNQQSEEIRKRYAIKNLPFYLLIDKNGSIRDKGYHFKPLLTSDKKKEMLN